MYQAILLHSEVDKHAESRNVVDLSAEFLSDVEVVDFSDRIIVWNLLGSLARVASRFFKFKYNVSEGRESDLLGDILVKFDAVEQISVAGQACNVSLHVGCNLFDKRIAFRMHGSIVKRVFSSRDS